MNTKPRPEPTQPGVIDEATAQTIRKIQRMLRLSNAPHSYKLVDPASLLRAATRLPASNDEAGHNEAGRGEAGRGEAGRGEAEL